MRKLFTISVKVEKPIVVGQDEINGRRQIVPIIGGTLKGIDINGNQIRGEVLPGGVDNQVIRPNGVCEVCARYAVRLESGEGFYIDNNGIRTVPDEYVQNVLNGEFVDPDLYYFVTTPNFETYTPNLKWMEKFMFVCKGKREPDAVHIHYYVVEG